jgi:ABC-2 type transport system ATP-binding protein
MADRVPEIDRISKRFGEVTAVREPSLEGRAGEALGFVGPNGAGRTTTTRTVLRMGTRVGRREALRSVPR